MKIFHYCNKQLKYVPYTFKFYLKLSVLSIVVILIASVALFYSFNSYYQERKMVRVNEELKVIILKEYNKFDRTAMIHFLKELNIKFPHIVYAQAILESTDFTSNIFRENNNCFGMKVATLRQTTNKGEQYNHAVFDTWKDCIIDYALYQARYLSSIKTEAQYFEYLQQSYAEDTNYVNKLKTIIHKKNLKEILGT